MLPDHIVEREDRKTLSLLAFALNKAGIPGDAWQAVMRFEDLEPADQCVCLFKQDGWWKVSYTERGSWREDGRFPSSYYAIKFMFSILAGDQGPYRLREDWERDTGQEFSMIE